MTSFCYITERLIVVHDLWLSTCAAVYQYMVSLMYSLLRYGQKLINQSQ